MEKVEVVIPTPRPEPEKDNTGQALAVVFLIIVGIAFIVNGCGAETDAKAIMQQIYGAIQYSSGWLIISAAFILYRMK